LTGFIWIITDADIRGTAVRVVPMIFALALVFAGLTMVTNVPFYSFKDMQHEEAACRSP
jgi:CDP-diacylglycerol--serine O-phosphatidyltransferase